MNIDEFIAKYLQFTEHYADCKARLTYLQHYRQGVLARVSEKSDEPTVTGRERAALASEEYRNYLDGLSAAIVDEVNAHYRVKAEEMRFDHWRTSQATERAERKGYGA